MARQTAIRTTIEPGTVIKVDDAELLDLHRQGLIHSSEAEGYGSHQWKPDADEVATDESTGSKADKKKGA